MPKYTLRSSNNIRNAYYNMFIAKESTEMDEATDMEEQQCAKEGDIETPNLDNDVGAESPEDKKKMMIERAKGLLEEAMAEIEGASGADTAVEGDEDELDGADADVDMDAGADVGADADLDSDIDSDIDAIGDEPEADLDADTDSEMGGDGAKLDQIIDLLSQLVSLEKGETEEPDDDEMPEGDEEPEGDDEEPEEDNEEPEEDDETEEESVDVMKQAKEALKVAKKAMSAIKSGGKKIVGGSDSVKVGGKLPAVKQTGKSSKKKK